MRLRSASVWTAVVGGAMSFCVAGVVAWSQTPAPTPKNPISTAPEGQQTPQCSYSGGVSNGKVTSSSNCPQNGGSTAQRFPYPGDTRTPALPVTDAPQANGGQQNGGQQNGSQQSKPNAAQRFPYPGEDSGGAQPGNGPLKDAGSSGDTSRPDDSSSSSSSSSSSNGGFNPDTPDDSDKDPLPAPKRARKKMIKPATPEQTPDERVDEDLKVAAFYQNDGNFQAAYLRAKDAVSLAESDPEAHFMLAEAARKLGKLDEAEKNYKRCLELDPVPKQKKGSEKALKEMSGS